MEENTEKTIYEQLQEAGVPLDHHESDLYAKVTPTSKAIVDAYKFKSNVTTFTCQIDGTPWYDIPFAYQPFWEKVERISKGREAQKTADKNQTKTRE